MFCCSPTLATDQIFSHLDFKRPLPPPASCTQTQEILLLETGNTQNEAPDDSPKD